MADVTVDSLQIEIEANSSKAAEQVNKLSAALERLKQGIGGSALSSAAKQIKQLGTTAQKSTPSQKKEAAEKATSGFNALKAAKELERLDAQIEKTEKKIAGLERSFNRLTNYGDKKQELFGAREQKELEGISESLSRLQNVYAGLKQQRDEVYSGFDQEIEPKVNLSQIEKLQQALDNLPQKDLTGAETAQAKMQNGKIAIDDSGISDGLDDVVKKTSRVNERLLELKQRLFEINSEKPKIDIESTNIDALKQRLQEAREIAIELLQYAILSTKTGSFVNDAELQKVVDARYEVIALEEAIEELNNQKAGIKVEAGQIENAKKSLKDFLVMERITTEESSALKYGLDSLRLGFLGLAKAALKGAGAIAKGGLNLAAAGVKMLGLALLSLGSGAVNFAVSGLKKLGNYVGSKFTAPFQRAVGVINKVKSAFGRIMFYRAIRTAIQTVTNGLKEGIDNLYQYSTLAGTQFAPAMNRLATASLYLKNSLGAMAAPLVEALAPAIDFIIDKFVALLNVVNRVFAALTGKSSYTVAKKQAKDYADAANGAAKATQKFLLGIDELNIINEDSGGGGAGTDYGSMFEEMEIDSDTLDWAKQIREAIENGDWRGAGAALAEKLNSLLESWDSYSWGYAFGQKITNGLNLIYGFVTTFNWELLGSKVADGLNGLMDGVDWDLLGRTFASKWNALVDFIYGFVTTFHWEDLGANISAAINGWFDEIDWEKAAETLSEGIKGVLKSITSLFSKTDFEEIGKDIAEFLNNIDWEGIVDGAIEAASAVIEGIFDLIVSLTKNLDGVSSVVFAIGEAFATWKISSGVLGWFEKLTSGKLGKALESAGTSIGKITAGLTLSITGFTLEYSGVYDAVYNGPDLQNIVKTALGSALGIAGSLLIFGTGPLGWSVGIGLALTIGLVAYINAQVDKAIDEYHNSSTYKKLQAFIAEAKKSIEITKEIKVKIDAYIDDYQSIQNKFAGIRDIIEKIFELDAIEYKTSEQLSQLSSYVDIINGLNLEGLHIDLDPDGKVVQTKEQLIAVTNELLKQAKIEAAYGYLVELYKARYDSVYELQKANEGLTRSQEELAVAGTKYAEASKAFADAELLAAASGGKMLPTLIDAHANLKAAEEAFNVANTATTEWESALKSANDAITDTENKIVYFENELTNLNQTTTETGDLVGNAFSGASSQWDVDLGAAKDTAVNLFDSIEQESEIKFGGIAQTISKKWAQAKENTSSEWSKISNSLDQTWSDVNRTADTKFEEVNKTVKNKLSTLKNDATTWGGDICSNLASGIRGAMGTVTSAVSSVARNIREFLHFSEPDTGPLSDFHTYMPDMLSLMAKGIKDNTYLAVNAASELANSVKDVFAGMQYSASNIKITSLPDVQANYSIAYANSNATNGAVVQPDMSGSMRDANNDVINAVYAIGQQIIEAIRSNGGDVYLDGEKVGSRTTQVQNRQNRMYGKTLQNA